MAQKKADSIWSIRGVDENLRRAVREEAIQSGKSLGTTLADILQEHYSRTEQSADPAAWEDLHETGHPAAEAADPTASEPDHDISFDTLFEQQLTGDDSAEDQVINTISELSTEPAQNFSDDPFANILLTTEELRNAIAENRAVYNSDKPVLSLPPETEPGYSAGSGDSASYTSDPPQIGLPQLESDSDLAGDEFETDKEAPLPPKPDAEIEPATNRVNANRYKVLVASVTFAVLTLLAVLFGPDVQADSPVLPETGELAHSPTTSAIQDSDAQVQVSPAIDTSPKPRPRTAESDYDAAMDLMRQNATTTLDPQSVELLKSSALDGYAPAMLKLALYLLTDTEKQQNKTNALFLLQSAAAKGHAPAQLLLGAHHIKGEIVAKDEEIGARWLYEAAKNGSQEALYLLGLQLSLGRGVEQDLVAGYKLLSAVYANSAHADAGQALEQIYPIIPPNRLSEIPGL